VDVSASLGIEAVQRMVQQLLCQSNYGLSSNTAAAAGAGAAVAITIRTWQLQHDWVEALGLQLLPAMQQILGFSRQMTASLAQQAETVTVLAISAAAAAVPAAAAAAAAHTAPAPDEANCPAPDLLAAIKSAGVAKQDHCCAGIGCQNCQHELVGDVIWDEGPRLLLLVAGGSPVCLPRGCCYRCWHT
jgi:hypothetical protein